MARRALIVLDAAAGKATKVIALSSHLGEGTASKWCTRFASDRFAGPADAPRTGKPTKYDRTTERRILAQLDQAPPEVYTTWTGGLVDWWIGGPSLGGRLARRSPPSAAPAWGLPAAPPQLVPQHRPSVRPESRRHRGALPEPTGERRGYQRGREARHPSLGAGLGWLRLPNARALRGIPMNTSGMAPPTCSPRWRSAREPFRLATTVASGAASSWSS